MGQAITQIEMRRPLVMGTGDAEGGVAAKATSIKRSALRRFEAPLAVYAKSFIVAGKQMGPARSCSPLILRGTIKPIDKSKRHNLTVSGNIRQ